MGLNFGTLTKLLLGCGLGILIVSCLAVTICFGSYANSFTRSEKIDMKFSFDYQSSVYSASIAIAVLGCIAFATALATFILTILMEEQTIILIIIGGVSSFFTFGCIIAEGVFTLYAYKFTANQYSYVLKENNHKNAQKYIKKAIEELYTQAVSIFKEMNKEDSSYSIPEWSEFERTLGTINNDDRIITYDDVWNAYEYNNVTLNYNSPYIIARYNGQVAYVGYTKFSLNGTCTPKKRICWYNSDKTDFNCETFKDEKKPLPPEYDISYFNPLTEAIVVDKHISPSDALKRNITFDYYVSGFPIAYKKLNYDDDQKIKNDIPLSFTDSSNHFKLSGKQFAKYQLDEKIDECEYIDDNRYNMNPIKPTNYSSFELDCDGVSYEDKNNYFICIEYNNYYDNIASVCKRNSKENKEGKTPSFIKKHLYSLARSNLKESWKDISRYYILYNFAIMNLIIQIFGILLWACGRFLGIILGKEKNDDKTPSEGEA